jgi:hypothetical protein
MSSTKPNRRSVKDVIAEVLALLVASFRHEGNCGRFLPFDVYPSSYRPPMTKPRR